MQLIFALAMCNVVASHCFERSKLSENGRSCCSGIAIVSIQLAAAASAAAAAHTLTVREAAQKSNRADFGSQSRGSNGSGSGNILLKLLASLPSDANLKLGVERCRKGSSKVSLKEGKKRKKKKRQMAKLTHILHGCRFLSLSRHLHWPSNTGSFFHPPHCNGRNAEMDF